MALELYDYQLEAVDQMKNGSILCGGVGSGKSRTALAYYFFKVCEGRLKVNGIGKYEPMKKPRDLYIITTAKKRDSLEWDDECYNFVLGKTPETALNGVKVTIDSWNNIKKYQKVYGAFFIFDEQRLVGSGAWVKSFYQIAKKNQWILLSATPGDKWEDYIPVFVANGFYRNRTEFKIRHCVYSRYSKYPKIERYLEEDLLKKHRDELLVGMKDNRMTLHHDELVSVTYDKLKFRQIYVERWDPYDECPIAENGKLYYLMRKVVNSDPSRIQAAANIVNRKDKCIIFYNFTYELDILRSMCEDLKVDYAEWNGQKHEQLPEGERWVYLVQYSAGCEGWNCITTDTVIFYSQNYSYRVTEQAAGRIDRANTPYKDLYYYRLRSSAWIDLAIYRAYKNKKNFNESSRKLVSNK
jgi:hypothetical protein